MAEIRISRGGFDKAQLMLSHLPRELEKADRLARSRAIQSARARAVESAQSLYSIKAAEIRSSITLRASEGIMTSRGRPIPLMKFKVTPRTMQRAVVRAQVKSSAKTLPDAFVTRMPNGNIGVYQRIGEKRLPIEQLYSVSAAQMLGEPTVVDDAREAAQEMYEKRIMHEVNRILSR